MVKLNCVIVDDEPLSLDLLEQYISSVPELALVARCPDAFQALAVMRQKPVDLLFADINMPQLSGLSMVRSLQRPPLVIFTTAYPEYAAEGFDINALDYLVKPISFERFMRAVNKAVKAAELAKLTDRTPHEEQNDPGSITLRVDRKHYRVAFRDILFAQAWGDYVKLQIISGMLLANASLKQLELGLPPNCFIRIHKSYLIALNRVEYLEGNQVRIGHFTIPVGISYRETLYQRLKIHPA